MPLYSAGIVGWRLHTATIERPLSVPMLLLHGVRTAVDGSTGTDSTSHPSFLRPPEGKWHEAGKRMSLTDQRVVSQVELVITATRV